MDLSEEHPELLMLDAWSADECGEEQRKENVALFEDIAVPLWSLDSQQQHDLVSLHNKRDIKAWYIKELLGSR